MKLPFIVTEKNISIRCIRLLVLMSQICTKNSKGFNADKISIFDFLLKYPNILGEICKQNIPKRNVQLSSYEYDNISTINIQSEYLNLYNQTKVILNLLIMYGYLDIIVDKEIRYIITDSGVNAVKNINTEWVSKLKENSLIIKEIKGKSYNQLDNIIRLSLGGDIIGE